VSAPIFGRGRRTPGGRWGASAGVLVASDTFTRANSALTLGDAETGGTWTPAATWGISSNTAYYVSGGSTYNTRAYLSVVGSANATVTVTLTTITATKPGLTFRGSGADTDNCWFLEADVAGYNLVKRVAGATTTVWSGGSVPANGDAIAVRLSGNDITVYINGAAQTTATDAFNASAIQHGLWNREASDALARYDSFLVTTP
jgi:hypothetical protein